MKINLQKYTKDRCIWMLFETKKNQIGLVWDDSLWACNPGIIFMNHTLDDAFTTQKLLAIKAIYL